jgi:hypothetical protein
MRGDTWTFNHDVTLLTYFYAEPSGAGWADSPIPGREHLGPGQASSPTDYRSINRSRLARIRDSILWHGERVRRRDAQLHSPSYLKALFEAVHVSPRGLIIPEPGSVIGEPRYAVLGLALRDLAQHTDTIDDALRCPHGHPEVVVAPGVQDGSEAAAVIARHAAYASTIEPKPPLGVVPENLTPFPVSTSPRDPFAAALIETIDREVEKAVQVALGPLEEILRDEGLSRRLTRIELAIRALAAAFAED